MCNEALNEADDLIANAQRESTCPLFIHYQPVLLSLVSEVIYKFRKHQEAERREVSVILLYTQCLVMTGAWKGCMLLDRVIYP